VPVSVGAVVALRRGGEAEAIGGQRALSDDTREGAREVMALIEDHEGVAVADRLGVDGGAVIGGHEQRRPVM
jgi:hypothetical protein